MSELTDGHANALDRCHADHPHGATLARAIYHRKRGEQRRGHRYVENTPQVDLEYMGIMHQEAKRDLARSLQLNPRSYIAELHVLNIAMHEGD